MLGESLGIRDYFSRLCDELKRLDVAELEGFSEAIFEAWLHRRSVFVCGNGGSAATASHLAQDLAKGVIREQDLRSFAVPRFKALSLTANISWLTALGNDLGYDQVFVQQLANFAQAGDVLIAISGSGNSPNIVTAVSWANDHGLVTLGMTGFDGGRLRKIQQKGVHVALDDMEMVESIHSCVCHWVVDNLRARIYRFVSVAPIDKS